ncbi:hypothetical protein EI94DRAFT_1741881 [Lactarius quietus]|nr:hypothetical protein EI94DRAFT_1741881 [Lactarius quietus]
MISSSLCNSTLKTKTLGERLDVYHARENLSIWGWDRCYAALGVVHAPKTCWGDCSSKRTGGTLTHTNRIAMMRNPIPRPRAACDAANVGVPVLPRANRSANSRNGRFLPCCGNKHQTSVHKCSAGSLGFGFSDPEEARAQWHLDPSPPGLRDPGSSRASHRCTVTDGGLCTNM